jgi:hypothetical protein
MNRTVSGCAIMVLVDQVTGIEVQSYGTDAGLLDALRESWPVEGASSGVGDGFRPMDLAGLDVVGAVGLTDHLGVALAAEPGGSYASVPIATEDYGGPWRRARPGDGLSAFVAGVPEASERPIGVDQTHESVVVGERAILKWFRRVGPGPSRASLLLRHLAEVGFDGIPAPLGSLAWRSPSGVELTLAQGDAYLVDARDGWEWCVEDVAARGITVDPTVRQKNRISRRFELTEQTRQALDEYLQASGRKSGEPLFRGRRPGRCLTCSPLGTEPRVALATFVVSSTGDDSAVNPSLGAETASGKITLRSTR